MKIKVWIVIWGLKDGGAETLAKDYARLVDRKMFDPTIVTMYPFVDTANYRRAKAAGIRVVSVFEKRNLLTRVVRIFLGKWYVPFRLKAMLKKDCPDVIHFNSAMAHYFAQLNKQLEGVNLVYTCHNEPDKHFFPKEEAAVRQMLHRHGSCLIALHSDMKQELDLRFGIEDTVVIRNGVDLSSFRAERKKKSEVLQSIGVPENAYVVGHVGRFSQQKNHGFLLKVFREIANKKKNAHLLLVGSGELQRDVEQMAQQLGLQDKMTILSHRTDIPDLLNAMDLVVFPSLYEGLSVTLVEAQASGLRCVISDTINPENHLTENTIPVSLNEKPEKWAEIALNPSIKNDCFGNIDDYDINREIRRLEELYKKKPRGMQ